ncbi:MAG: hypothetical protein NT018_03015 [Armatimonadetes bacterium]|nr:hypothetical protein [Armatimonadota bacterium]
MTRLRNLILVLIYALVAVLILVGAVCAEADDSPKKVRVIYSNDNMGYLEPCGCGGRYQGGLARRVTAFSQLIKENPNALIIDSGNISSQKENVGIIASIMSALKYDAIGIGAAETYYPDEFFKQSDKFGLRVLSTMAPESKNTSPYIIKSIDGVKVGVISYGRDIADPKTPPEIKEAFKSAYKTAKEKSEILIPRSTRSIPAKFIKQCGSAV